MPGMTKSPGVIVIGIPALTLLLDAPARNCFAPWGARYDANQHKYAQHWCCYDLQ